MTSESPVAIAREELRAAYEGLEASFPDRASEAAYRAALLSRTAPQVDLLGPLLHHDSALEIGCGNGRLLVALARRGLLREGIGIDAARSRIAFARRWAQEDQLSMLRFEVADALEVEPTAGAHDAIVCITGMFGYFEALAPGTDAALLSRWTKALVPGGLLVIELYPNPRVVALLAAGGGKLRLWHELPPGDPWRFYLSEYELEGGILSHAKTFIDRTTGEVDSGRRERLKLYSEKEARALLAEAGLTEVTCREGWADRPYDGGAAMVITARAPL
jgi:SAM-dependent methyltransferase